MKKSDIIRLLTERTECSDELATEVVSLVFSTILQSLAKGESVNLTGFGTFKIAERKGREVRNPATSVAVYIPAHSRPQFSFAESVRLAFRNGQQNKYIAEQEEVR